MATDREIIKLLQIGQLQGTDVSNARTAVGATHARPRDFLKTGSENAATNVAESPMTFLKRASKLRGFAILPSANVASDNSHYVVIKFYKRFTNGGSQTLIGSWNTHGGAQGALTALTAADATTNTLGLVTNSDGEIAANSILTYEILKIGNGQAVGALTMFSFGLEEI